MGLQLQCGRGGGGGGDAPTPSRRVWSFQIDNSEIFKTPKSFRESLFFESREFGRAAVFGGRSPEKNGVFRSSSLKMDPKTPNASYSRVGDRRWLLTASTGAACTAIGLPFLRDLHSNIAVTAVIAAIAVIAVIAGMRAGLYPIVTFQYSSTALYQFSYDIQYLFF